MLDSDRRSKAQARQESRDAMLEVGAEILRGAPFEEVLNKIKATEVARGAGRTTGAFYNIWKDQRDYRRDLIAYVLSPARFRVDGDTRHEIADQLSRPEFDLVELIRVAANLNFDGVKDEPYMPLQYALVASLVTNRDVHAELKRMYDELNDGLVPLYEAMLERSRRTMCRPYTVRTLAIVMMALAEGLHIRWMVDAGAVPDDVGGPPPGAIQNDGERWGLFAACVYPLFMAMTEPATDTREGSSGG